MPPANETNHTGAEMSFDFTKIELPSQHSKQTDPIKIFQASAITDNNINDLWLAQGDALREWNNNRLENDVAVVLNTGAGKTLVGLLIAQSLANETRRQVVYACSSIQLVEQTANKAWGYGLPVTTYYRGQFSPDGLYHRAEAPCVTTYQALFNGKTRFRNDDIVAVVFDDAHTAEHILRDQFSLTITRAEMPDAYEQIVALFQPYHTLVGLATSYAELSSNNSTRQFLIPPVRGAAQCRRIASNTPASEPKRTRQNKVPLGTHPGPRRPLLPSGIQRRTNLYLLQLYQSILYVTSTRAFGASICQRR